MQTFDSVVQLFSSTVARFRIATQAGDVYMCAGRTNYLNEERAVVEVDTGRLFALWRAEPNGLHAAQAHGHERTWRRDDKFQHAEEGFQGGKDNPVPLADISCQIGRRRHPIIQKKWLLFERTVGWNEHRFPYVAFTNGVTRTIWLAANGAKYFPVECHVREADRLQELAGLPGGGWKTLDVLVPR
ncbi:hypothetical protein BGLT_04953 [Caballeronia glathei]|jgi:hypothetical protein|uniref:Uncharacterized protein n=1 Tax=Caballeronia glathei TaxID=60547 RepID=A0A069PYN2_9BURK|nr:MULTISPECIES: hypothetical protein [Burkholderiaceae]KDR42521.1 hypothetical protein BG61_08775 [Caballeronia glathei]TCK34393.1 hypothetical protein B0G84_6339 [Paraburkholderia sp. BL8N3]CDY78648.1 hypothetical protein BGLT_04953 [Caballeronia glathei]